jgi:alkylation response protein AidB-like acyl-CoA dehydrogenase
MATTARSVDLVEQVRAMAEVVDDHAAASDRAGVLAAAIIDALHESRLVRMLLPTEHCGAGLTLRDVFPVFEAAGALDGALGWNLCIGSISLMVATAGVSEGARARILADPRALIAGGVNPGAVVATRVDGGYLFNGRVGFASGSADATWLFTAAIATGQPGQPGQPGDGEAGPPNLIGGLFPPHATSLLDTWHVSGMRATSSHDFVLDNVFVPDELAFPVALATAADDPLRSLPLPSMLGSGLAFVALGVAAHAIDRLVALATERLPLFSHEPLRHRADVQIATARARGLVDSARAYVTTTWDDVEDATSAGRPLSTDDLARLRLSYVVAVENAIAATDLAWAAAGSAALFEGEPLERCWRDVHAVGQHAFVSTRHFDRIGRITLGLPPGAGPI